MRWIRAAALLLLASASVRAATLTVTEPAAAALRGGSFAPLAWIPDSLPAGAEEWEAFLSIDGGAHYAFRITPHVDLALHRILWLVPNVDADDARILVRIGDEREEESIDVALSLRIKRDPRAPLPRPAVIPAPAGEPARSGEPGVTWWIEGDRKATRTVEMWHVKPAGLMQSRCVLNAGDAVAAIAPESVHLLDRTPASAGERAVPDSPVRPPSLVVPAEAILLRSCRRNI